EPRLVLGLHHEQQHQELILTDIKHVLGQNPMYPAYAESAVPKRKAPVAHDWLAFEGGIRPIGHDGLGFAFDNESPRHDELLRPFLLGSRLVTNAEFLEFIDDGGYKKPELWLSAGWYTVQEHGWEAPLYWQRYGSKWWSMTLSGLREVDPAEPVCHVSYFEADAFARWREARLPSEGEWEVAAASAGPDGNFVEDQRFHPAAASEEGLTQMFGDVWEWTQSPYSAYPGYKPLPGALGEYNGKFMCNQ